MSSKISVIVPCYNVEKYVSRTLDSLVNQTFKDLKIICIDDESSDNTFNILKEYQSKYDNIEVYSKKNEGIANARNFGLSKVDTEYFGFLDSDDVAEATMFEKMYNKIEQEQLDIVVCDFMWDFENNRNKNYVQHEGPYKTHEDMMLNLFATLWNKLYRTSFIKETKITFPDGYRYEDASFLYRLVPYVEKIGFINEPFVYYLQREGSITHTHNEKVKDMIHVFNDILEFYRDNYFLEQYFNELEYVFIRFFLGNSFLRSVQIKDKEDREFTLKASWDVLENNFPNWKENVYLNTLGGKKNLYYKLVNKHNYWLFAKIFTWIKK